MNISSDITYIDGVETTSLTTAHQKNKKTN